MRLLMGRYPGSKQITEYERFFNNWKFVSTLLPRLLLVIFQQVLTRFVSEEYFEISCYNIAPVLLIYWLSAFSFVLIVNDLNVIKNLLNDSIVINEWMQITAKNHVLTIKWDWFDCRSKNACLGLVFMKIAPKIQRIRRKKYRLKSLFNVKLHTAYVCFLIYLKKKCTTLWIRIISTHLFQTHLFTT